MRHPASSPLWDVIVGGSQIVVTLVGAPLLRRSYNHFGATPAERRRPLPGDDRVPHPKHGYTRAITIDAPPERVWPWLVQIGQGRGGFYSYDTLENLVGCRIQSADRILPEHQHLSEGDLIRSNPEDYPSWRVVDVDPPHHLVLMVTDPETGEVPPVFDTVPLEGYVASTWQWLLEPAGEGARTRLIVRQRLTYSPSQSLLWHVVEPFNFVMERRMLKGLKARAESSIDAADAAS